MSVPVFSLPQIYQSDVWSITNWDRIQLAWVCETQTVILPGSSRVLF